MSDLKAMYSTVRKDAFPETMTIILGEEKLVYEKRVWTLDQEEKGLRYGENPDQPAALYALKRGSLTCGGLSWRGPGNGIVSALTEAQMIQAGKHPGKTNLTDVDNGANILQYLAERPAAVILKHNNPCGAAWADDGVAVALERAFWCDRIAAFGGADFFHAQLHAAVELVARGAHLDDAARQRRLDGAIPHLRVDRAGFIGQRHIQIVFAVGAGALLGGADDQVALEAVVALDIRQIHIKTPSCVNDIMNDTGGVCKEKFRIAENMEKTGYEILYYPFGRGRGGGG